MHSGNVKSNVTELSDRNGERVTIGHWRKDGPCYEGAKDLAELRPSVSWKVELASDETGDLSKRISTQSVEGAGWFLLNA